jgi:hypothetical protein
LGDLGLNGLPARGVGLLGLIHDFEEDERGVRRGEVCGEGVPERGKALRAICALEECFLVRAFGVNVDDDGKALGSGLGDDGVELGHEVATLRAVLLPKGEGVGVDAEANVVEAETVDEGDVVEGGEGAEPHYGVVVRRLREPEAGVDAVAQMGNALGRQIGRLSGGKSAGKYGGCCEAQTPGLQDRRKHARHLQRAFYVGYPRFAEIILDVALK